MSDAILQPVPGQGAVPPEVQASGAGQSGTPAESATEQASQQGTEEAKPVTAQDLLALEERIAKQIQSQVDKGEGRAVKKAVAEVKASIETLKAAGHEISDKDAQALMSNAIQKATIAEATAEEPSAQSAQDWTDVSQWDQSDPIVQAVKDAQKEIGIALTAEMPEAKSVVRNQGPRKFLQTYEAALITAKARMSASEETKSKSTPAARIPAQGGSSSGTPASSASDYWKEAYKK